MKKTISFLLAASMLFVFAACGSPQEEQPFHTAQTKYTKELFAMGTSVTLTAYGENAETAVEKSANDLLLWQSFWSTRSDDSELSKANHAEGEPMEISDVTANLLRFTLEMSEKTDGRLDPTVQPLMNVWGFTDRNFKVPTDEELNAAKALVGYQKVSLEGNTLTMPAGMQLDFGAVAKGYACDLITDDWKAQGITSGLVNLGGNIAVIGKNETDENWKIAVQNPNDNSAIGILNVTDCSVVTSGSYIRYFEDENSNTYGHIMNPATGYPVKGDIKSVTVVGKDSKVCDALATAFYVMGFDGAVEYLQKNGETEAIFVTADDEIYITVGLQSLFDKAENIENIHIIG